MKNININKKFLIFFSLVLSLLFINSNYVKAYYEENDTIYSSTLKFDKNEYYDINLVSVSTLIINRELPSMIVETNNETNSIKITNPYSDTRRIYFNMSDIQNQNISISFKSDSSNGYLAIFSLDISRVNLISGNNYINNLNYNDNTISFYIYANTTINITNIMVNNGSSPLNYSTPFRFGYNVSNKSNDSFTLNFIDNYDTNKTYTLKNNSSIYIPFQYLNNEVTFSYNVIQNVSSNIENAINIKFTPVFTGTLKSNNTNILKSTFTYVYNYLYYKNLKLSSYKDIYLDDMLEIIYPTTNKDSKSLTLTSVISPNNVISNFTSDIKQTNIIDKDTYFNGSNSLYNFNLNTYMYSSFNGLLYSINFESINLGVINSSVTNSFPTDTDNDLEIYKTCDGNIFQDFNCNLTNAFTWTVFNIPIIGPLIGFISNLIQLISQLVQALEWYQSLGILFSIFILIMFIKILGILWKGKDE